MICFHSLNMISKTKIVLFAKRQIRFHLVVRRNSKLITAASYEQKEIRQLFSRQFKLAVWQSEEFRIWTWIAIHWIIIIKYSISAHRGAYSNLLGQAAFLRQSGPGSFSAGFEPKTGVWKCKQTSRVFVNKKRAFKNKIKKTSNGRWIGSI